MDECIDSLSRRKESFGYVQKFARCLEKLADTSGFGRESICGGGHRLSKDLEQGTYKTSRRKNNPVWLQCGGYI